MSVEVNLSDKTSLTNQDMENKENADSPARNQVGRALEKSSASPSLLNSSAVLKQSSKGINCGPESITTAAVSKVEPAERKNLHMSFSQAFLLKKRTKEKPQDSTLCLPEKRVLGSYRGKIVSSKINSFRKSENEEKRNSLAVPAKPVAKSEPRKDRVTNTGNASKPMASLQTKPPVKVLVDQPKAIWNHEKPSVKTSVVNKVAIQKKPNKNWTPVIKTVPCNAANSEQRPKKSVPPPGALAGSVSESNGARSVLVSNTFGNRKSALLQSTEMRRSQLAEWQASKGKVLKKQALKKPPAPLQTDACPAIEEDETIKESPKSFWASIAEEDEQHLLSETVNKTLTKCLGLIEKGHSADKIHSTLEDLIRSVPDAKKLAKYWICRMRLEQLGTLEKVMAVYEEAILAGAQPKDELRSTLTAVLKDIKNLPNSDGECGKKEMAFSCTAGANLEESVEVQANSKVEPHNEEETSLKAEACSKPEEENTLDDEEPRIKESSQMPEVCKKEQNVNETQKNEILEWKTPEHDNARSYLVMYNVSTTPSLESVKKKLQCENSKSAVKDLKVLTPVRRSRRIQGKVCKLPDMLKDQNPCISSLEQLGELGEEAVAFVYRPNHALHKAVEGQDKI